MHAALFQKSLLSDNDLILFSDADEIPAGDHLRFLKFCEVKREIIPKNPSGLITTWLLNNYFGRLDKIYVSVNTGFEESWGLRAVGGGNGDKPRVLPLSVARSTPVEVLRWSKTTINRKRPRHFWGGWHLSDNSYLPFVMLKVATHGEAPDILHPWSIFGPLLQRKNASKVQKNFQTFYRERFIYDKVRDLREMPAIQADLKLPFSGIPWIMKCNPNRYAAWFMQTDLRYDMKPPQSLYNNGEPSLLSSRSEWLETVKRMRKQYNL